MKLRDSVIGVFASALLLAPPEEIRSQDWPRNGDVVYVSKALQGALLGTEAELSADPRAPILPPQDPPPGGEDVSGGAYRDGTQPLGALPRVVKPPLASACQPLKVATVADDHLRLRERWHRKRAYSLGAEWRDWVHRTREDCIKAQQRESPQTQPGVSGQ